MQVNKLLHILLVVVLSGCVAGKHAIISDDVNTLDQLKSLYFKNEKRLAPIEGIWNYGDRMVAIVKNEKNMYQGEDYLGFLFQSGNWLNGKTIYKIRKSASNPNLFVGSMFNQVTPLPPYDMMYTPGTFQINDGKLVITPNNIHFFQPMRQHTLIKTWPQYSIAKKTIDNISGSGFYINNKGNVVTNHHVIKDCNKIAILKDNSEIEASLIGQDRSLDLAVLKTDSKTDKFIKISKNPGGKLQEIIAAGYPFGKFLNDDLKFTSGIISALKGPNDNSSLMQIDAALNFGNSGGPIVDRNTGNLLGIAVSGIRTDKIEGINFAVKNVSLMNFLQTNDVTFKSTNNNARVDRDKLSQNLESSTVYIKCK